VTDEVAVVLDWRAQHAYPIKLVMPQLRRWADQHSSSGIRPAERLKRTAQIVQKLIRHPGMKLARMQDVGGARCICSDGKEVERVHQGIVDRWQPVRPADYRDDARSTGYRGLHLMVKKRDNLTGHDREVEIQLRTIPQHRWAQAVMATGNRLGYALQDGDGPDELCEYFRMASDLLYAQERGALLDPATRARFHELREQVRPYFLRND
jgi:ppGpp synthetase/RelA/SpoT-type nucleotidyltranferase